MRALELIEYPGRVVNVDNMIATLGGIVRISQAFGGEQKNLELRYHPQNPFNKAINGDSAPNTGLLLSIKVRRSKRNKSEPPKYEVSVLGHCEKTFTFPNLCDFQYLPLYKHPTSSTFYFDLKTVVPASNTDTEFFDHTNASLLCLPQTFARSDSTRDVGLLRNDTQEDGQQDKLDIMQKPTYDAREIVVFNMVDKFPTKSDAQLTKRMKVKYISDDELKLVKEMFDKCPIWTRVALLYESGLSNEKFKYILPYLTYHFSTGPWRLLYVRYGYDPRKDFQSRHYQTFDFRIRFRSGVVQFVANKRDTMRKKQENPCDVNELAQDINYPYLDEHKLPRSRQCILRYCDLHIPKIQEMLEKIPSPLTGAVCTERTGWLPAGFDVQVRQIVSAAIKNVLRNHCRKDQTTDVDAVDEDGDADAMEEQQDYIEDDEEIEEEEDELIVNEGGDEYFDENEFLSQTVDHLNDEEMPDE